MGVRIALLVGCAALVARVATAEVLRVEQDGSGGFLRIHDAIGAAAPGDTILVGPGRYDDFHPLVAPAWTRDVIAIIDKTGLTLIGAGPDATIIGPEVPVVGTGLGPAGIASISGASATIVGMGIENVNDGVYWDQGGVAIADCRFRECVLSVIVFEAPNGLRISRSEFSTNRSQAIGVLTYTPYIGLTVADCTFSGPGINETAIVAIGTPGATISRCVFRTSGGVTFEGASGRIEDCVSEAPSGLPVWATNAASIQMYGNRFMGDFASLYVNGWSVVSGSGNVFSGGRRLATVYITSQSQVTLSGNDIIKTGQYAAMIGQYFYEIQTNDLTNNYWGTSDPDSIAAWIWDYSDDPVTRAHIDYIPFAPSTVPRESRSLGDLKALFRGR